MDTLQVDNADAYVRPAEIVKSERLEHLKYDIRGPVYEKALELESQGYKIINLNIGNPAAFGFDAPDEIVHDIILNIRNAQGYADSRGLFAARKAVMHHTQNIGLPGITINDIYIGNGVSELIMLAMQALLNEGDEVLIPTPDYPLWTASVAFCGGKAVHYHCDEANGWNPSLADMEAKITPRTRAVVVINPNNPTGAVYDKTVLEQMARLAEKHKLIVFSDEIYDRILYDGAEHHHIAKLVHDTLCITMGGLSKNYRSAGFRGGWLILSGARHRAKSYIEGLTLLASMRLCANVPTQFAIQTALGGYQSIRDLVLPAGRLHKQIMLAWQRMEAIPGISCVKPRGALYIFPKIDLSQFYLDSDDDFVLNLLIEQKVLVVAGSGFNFTTPDHFRIVCLPTVDELNVALDRIEAFLESRRR